MQRVFPIIAMLQKPQLLGIFALVGGAFFYLNYLMLSKLPGSNGYMCTVGGNLTLGNLLLAGLISVQIALIFAGLLEMRHRNKTKRNLTVGSVSGAGIITGALASFCAICTLPVISLFGIGSFLALVAQYEIYVKFVSIGLLGVALYFLNQQLRDNCKICKL